MMNLNLYTISFLNCILIIQCLVKSRTLNEVLKHYETLNTQDVAHTIVKRSNFGNAHERHLNFKSHGRQFHLKLTSSTDIFASGFKAVTIHADGSEHPIPVNQNNFYKGRLLEDYKSKAIAHVEDNMITASITTSNDTYLIEPMSPHVDEHKELYKNKMIVYKVTDLRWNLTHSNSSQHMNYPPPTCAVDSTKKFIVKDGILTEEERGDEENDKFGERNVSVHSRQKRNAVLTSKTMCDLVLVSDYLFYKQMGGSSTLTVNYMLQVANFVNNIFEKTTWSADIGSGVGVQVKKVIVHDEHSTGDASYNNQNVGPWIVDRLLSEFSRTNWENFCLAHLFTYQDFARGVIGLAYVASPDHFSVGGICTASFTDAKSKRYLNCGLSSGQNWGRQLLTLEAQLVTAHEIGHNFGSSHDQPSCESPDGGRFIMYATSVAGEDNNNNKFSQCSKNAIAAVLRSKRKKCFKDRQESFCGNQKVEDGEECDTGLDDDKDRCCYRCELRKKMQCSPLNSPCCTNQCQFADDRKECRPAFPLECNAATFCNGLSAKCPTQSPKLEQKEQCGLSKGNCLKNQTGKIGDGCVPLCSQHNKLPCICNAGGDACKVCCQDSPLQKCVPLRLEGYRMEIDNDGVPCQLTDGTGYCNEGQCDKIQTSVASEFADLLQDFTFSNFVRFMEANIVGTIIVLSLFLWIPLACVVHYLDEKQDEEHEEMKNWLNPFSTDLIQSSGALNKVKMLFHRGNQKEQKLPRTQYHISS